MLKTVEKGPKLVKSAQRFADDGNATMAQKNVERIDLFLTQLAQQEKTIPIEKQMDAFLVRNVTYASSLFR